MADGSGSIVPQPDPPTRLDARASKEAVMSARLRKTHRKLAPILECLIDALEAQDADHRSGAAGALRAFGHLAAVEIPNRGAFAPDDPGLYSAIEAIADKHLGFRE